MFFNAQELLVQNGAVVPGEDDEEKVTEQQYKLMSSLTLSLPLNTE